jgi:hypothetical protein
MAEVTFGAVEGGRGGSFMVSVRCSSGKGVPRPLFGDLSE